MQSRLPRFLLFPCKPIVISEYIVIPRLRQVMLCYQRRNYCNFIISAYIPNLAGTFLPFLLNTLFVTFYYVHGSSKQSHSLVSVRIPGLPYHHILPEVFPECVFVLSKVVNIIKESLSAGEEKALSLVHNRWSRKLLSSN